MGEGRLGGTTSLTRHMPALVEHDRSVFISYLMTLNQLQGAKIAILILIM
jgi:hypothetical protein